MDAIVVMPKNETDPFYPVFEFGYQSTNPYIMSSISPQPHHLMSTWRVLLFCLSSTSSFLFILSLVSPSGCKVLHLVNNGHHSNICTIVRLTLKRNGLHKLCIVVEACIDGVIIDKTLSIFPHNSLYISRQPSLSSAACQHFHHHHRLQKKFS